MSTENSLSTATSTNQPDNNIAFSSSGANNSPPEAHHDDEESQDTFFRGEEIPEIPEMFDKSHNFSYETTTNPENKKNIPRLQIYDTKYELINSNGFVKVYTKCCRVYWVAQNMAAHRTPDWKFHFSIHPDDISTGWNILVALFLRHQCRSGIKVNVGNNWPKDMYGREITIYMMTYDRQYDNGVTLTDPYTKKDVIFPLNYSMEHSRAFWVELIAQAEYLLKKYNVKSRGCADGDRKVGHYSSIRNETYTKVVTTTEITSINTVHSDSGADDNNNQSSRRISVKKMKLVDYVYPPNTSGWNPENQPKPFRIKDFIHDVEKRVKVLEGKV